MKVKQIMRIMSGENISNKDRKELKEYLSSVYDIKEDRITIN